MLVAASAALASDRASLTGRIADASGKPVEAATVLVYRAGVKKGYSTYCPTCYVDCGKRTITDRSGSFTIQNLNPELWFDLVVLRDGYSAALVKKVDPSKGPAGPAVLTPRAAVSDPTRVVRGRVVDLQRRSVGAVVIEPQGISQADWNGRGPASRYGTIDGLEPFAVSNQKGEFELAHSEAATGKVIRYRVRRTDTAASIADEFDVTTAELRKWNHLRSDHVARGMALRIYPGGMSPAPQAKSKAASPGTVMARRQGPQDGPVMEAATGTVVHHVKPGETLWSIARAYRTTVEAIQSGNHFLFSRPLQVGDTLTILSAH